jgi:hypothetical protein
LKNYKTLYANIEEPYYEDDNPASITKGGLIRLYEFDAKSRKNTAQYAYLLDPVLHEPKPKKPLRSMVYQQFNIIARPIASSGTLYSTGTQACTIKVYLCDVSKRLT